MSNVEEKLLRFERARRYLVNMQGPKAESFEREYSRSYDVLALAGIGGRRRLRAKYRG